MGLEHPRFVSECWLFRRHAITVSRLQCSSQMASSWCWPTFITLVLVYVANREMPHFIWLNSQFLCQPWSRLAYGEYAVCRAVYSSQPDTCSPPPQCLASWPSYWWVILECPSFSDSCRLQNLFRSFLLRQGTMWESPFQWWTSFSMLFHIIRWSLTSERR